MSRKVFLSLLILAVFAGSYFGKLAIEAPYDKSETHQNGPQSKPAARDEYKKIVSLSPSITETLFSLGQGDKVIGVTNYCDYPPEALTKTKVGGYYDPNYETIVSLQPDLIILYPEHEKHRLNFKKLGLDTLVVDHNNIDGILSSIKSIGEKLGATKKADSIVNDIKARIERIEKVSAKTSYRPKVMVSVGRSMGSNELTDIYIAGNDGFYDELIRLAGAENVYRGDISFPSLSTESVIRLNPDIIIDMVSDLHELGLDENRIVKEWEALSQVTAVMNGRIHIFGEGYTVIPGPRFILTLEKMARTIHPKTDWSYGG